MMSVAAWWPVTLVHCDCLIGKPPSLIVLNALGQPGMCPSCGGTVKAVDIAKDVQGRLLVLVDVAQPKLPGH